MQQPNAQRPYRLLRPDEVEAALAPVRTNPALQGLLQDGKGFRILAEEPELYNKWLITIPDATGTHLVGLSRRFCPLTNQWYAAAYLYYEDISANKDLFPVLSRAADELFRQPGIRVREVLSVDKLSQKLRSKVREWYNPLNWILLERDVGREEIVQERSRVRWDDEAGPIWLEGDGRRVGTVGDPQMVYQLQNNLDKELGLSSDTKMRKGIQRILAHLKRHRFLPLFTHGTFLVGKCSDRTTGCAWCYRSFRPWRSEWVVWMDRPYILEEYRRQRWCSSLYKAALSVFAEAGYPTKLRIWIRRGETTVRVVHERLKFREASDGGEYWLELETP